MEALNAVGLTPIPILSDRIRRKEESRKISYIPTSKYPILCNLKHIPLKDISRNLNGGVTLLSSIIISGCARALTYEEALQQSVNDTPTSDLDVGGVIDTVSNYATQNPAVIIGGAVVLVIPFVLSQVLGNKPKKPWGVESARSAYGKLGDGNVQLLDIRSPSELRQVGSPDIRGLKKKPVAVTYNGEDKVGFLKKLSFKFKEPQIISLFIIDKDDGNSELVAELVTSNGFKTAYAIKDGVEGWLKSGLPWIEPKKTFSIDFSSFNDAMSEGADAFSITLGLTAATGLGLLAFTEVETLLQILGSAAIIQFVSKKLLFAEDRKQTLQKVDDFVTTKIAPNEIVDEIKQIGKALLPSVTTRKALLAPVQPSPAITEKLEAVAALTQQPKTEVSSSVQPAPEIINAVTKPEEEVKTEFISGIPRPLSPYTFYPDLKPPTSPSPSKP